MDIGHFQRHLTELSGDTRRTLHREGKPRHYTYRFRNPLLQPFVKMVGRAKGLVSAGVGKTCMPPYNFARPHQTLTKRNGGRKTTPAMAAGKANRVWTLTDIAGLLEGTLPSN